MTMKSLALGSAMIVMLGGAAFAADNADNSTTKAPNAASVAAAKAGTEVEKAVGASDSFSQDDVKSEISLNKVADAQNKLATAKVDDMSVHIIGPVKSVVTSAKGMATAIHVDAGGWLGVGEKVVSLKATNFKYLPDRNILVTNISKAEVKNMKPIPGNSVVTAKCNSLNTQCADRPNPAATGNPDAK